MLRSKEQKVGIAVGIVALMLWGLSRGRLFKNKQNPLVPWPLHMQPCLPSHLSGVSSILPWCYVALLMWNTCPCISPKGFPYICNSKTTEALSEDSRTTLLFHRHSPKTLLWKLSKYILLLFLNFQSVVHHREDSFFPFFPFLICPLSSETFLCPSCLLILVHLFIFAS